MVGVYFMSIDLKREIDYIKRQVRKASRNSIPEEVEEIKRKYFKIEFQNMIRNHFTYFNIHDLYISYNQYFYNKKLPIIKIKKGQRNFFRARIGYNSILGTENGMKKEYIFPYFKEDISAPHWLLARGGRFNHEGVYCLYLSDKIGTCISEIHLQVGQKCTIAEFECTNDISLIDFTKIKDNTEMQCWLNLLTEPIHPDILYKYNITRFLANVLRNINEFGLYIRSTQTEGNNIICYKQGYFEPIKYSSRIYMAKKITYDYDIIEDSIDKCASEGIDYIDCYSNDLSGKNKYLADWIKQKRQ